MNTDQLTLMNADRCIHEYNDSTNIKIIIAAHAKISRFNKANVQCIGFAADSGETIQVQIVRQKKNENGVIQKVFLGFGNIGSSHMKDEQYRWFDVPNEWIRLVPKVKTELSAKFVQRQNAQNTMEL